MRHSHTLEIVPNEGKIGKPLVCQSPIGKHSGERGENVQLACCAATCVCCKESRYHYIGPIPVNWCDIAL